MEKEVRKKKATYEIAAVFLAVLLMAIIFNSSIQTTVDPTYSQLKTFSSYDELENFLKVNSKQTKELEKLLGYSLSSFRGSEIDSLISPNAKAELEYASDYSTTNIQVFGVDEADIVKTDGENLYVVSNQKIYVLKVYPTNQVRLLSKIELNEVYSAEIYLNEDKLAVLGNKYHYPIPYIQTEKEQFIAPYPYLDEACVRVYDLTDKENPVLMRTVILNGTLSGSRMVGNYVYAVVNQPAILPDRNESDLEVILPMISGDYVKEVEATDVRYVNVSDVFHQFTTVIAVNVMDNTQVPTYETFLTGQNTNMYVSHKNMYLVVPHTNLWILQRNDNEFREKTLIYRFSLNEEKIVAEAEGVVYGYVLNQFSMDEYKSFFRIATTIRTSTGSKNSLYILNKDLDIVGKLTNMAPGESIYSVRFMDDRCYLVTFKQVDPFFVIDVSNHANPKVLGYLKIPGFSSYLHPYDEDHIIGIGKQNNNVKLALFDITNIASPTERAKYIIRADWSESAVLLDHKAFLFDRSRQLLALPVLLNSVMKDMGEYSTQGYWQGAYIFEISLEKGFLLESKITHQNMVDQFQEGLEVKRILYIEDVLYTVSERKVKMNNLENFESMGKYILS